MNAWYRQNLAKNTFIEPYAGAAYLHSHTQAFEESGAGILNLDYAARTSNLGRFTAGLKSGMNLTTPKQTQFKPWISMGAAVYSGDTSTTQNLTLGVLNQPMSARGAPSTALTTGAGLSLQSSSGNWRATLGFAGEYSDHSHYNEANLKVRYHW